MRKVIAVALSVAVQAAALGSPFVHAHPDEHATTHHAGGSVHTHWAGHPSSHAPANTPAFTATDQDRAVFLSIFVAVAPPHAAGSAIAQPIFALTAPAERAAASALTIARSHSPPAVLSLPSRAPPASLS